MSGDTMRHAADPYSDSDTGRWRTTLLRDRLWFIVAWRAHKPGHRFLTLSIQRRIADPPAIEQTRHHSVILATPRWLRPYLPNTSDRLALVSLLDPEPFRAHWPLRLTQIVGGRRWSLSLVTYRTPQPITTPKDGPS